MKTITINRRKTTFFSELANQINDNNEALEKYIQAPFSMATIEQRTPLHEIVSKLMSAYSHFDKVAKNIDLLKEEDTFTVTAGHQLNVFGGPLCVIYKIMDAVRLAEKLKTTYPDKNFVPVFWMASEDHDFEEINHLHLFGSTFSWETEQKGPVGRFSLEGIERLKADILSKFGNNPEYSEYLDQFYKNGNLAE